MNDELWRTAYSLLEEAGKLPAVERTAWIERTTGDPTLRKLVFAMLEESEEPCDAPAPEVQLPVERQPGSRIGRFEIQRLIGSGGTGHVYAATDAELGRTVALKFFHATSDGSAPLIDAVLPEAQAVSALNHPNIVTLYEVLRTPADSALVMELVEGVPLRKLASSPHSVEEVASWGLQVARGLAAAHARGIVHRDIKPENLMLRSDGLVKILDFGAAAKFDPGGSLGQLPIGTVGYMSPEQLRSEPLTPATDMFSLGVVLWELAAGRHPFFGATAGVVTRAIANQEPGYQIPQSRRSGAFERLLRRMLEKNPAARPDAQAVEKLLSDLIRSRQGRSRRLAVYAGAIVLTAAVPAWLALSSIWPPTPSPVVTNFTAYEGLESEPAFSPDGTRLAFAWTGETGGIRHVYTRPLDGEKLSQLTRGDVDDTAPAWSPDARSIAFLRRSTKGNDALIMVAGSGGGEPRAVARIANPQGYPRPLAWWPDGGSLLARDAVAGGVGLMRVDLATGTKQPVTQPTEGQSDGLPVLAPDGRRFAFVRYRVGAGSVCLLELSGAVDCRYTSKVKQGDSINGLIRGLAWKQDGTALYFADKAGIWRLPLGWFARPAKIQEGAYAGLAADPKRARLAFSQELSEEKLFSVDPATGTVVKLPGSSASEQEAEFSPDGEHMCFRSNRTGTYELWSSRLDGSDLRQVTSFKGHLGSARYSPDGRWIVFDGYGSPSDKTRDTNIYIVPAGGGPVRRLTDDVLETMVPAWSRDQRWIYYMQARGGEATTWKLPFAGGAPVKVADWGMFDLWESEDGNSLYYSKLYGNAGVYRRRTAGGPEELIPGTGAVHFVRYWQPGQPGIFFASGPAQARLMLLDWKTGAVRDICPLPGKLPRGPRGMAVSRDGSRVVYMRQELGIGDISFLEKLE